jgi:hypothetical protein
LEVVRGNAVRREDRSRPWEEPDPPSSSTPASSASTSLHHRLLPSRRRAAPPFFSDACTTARGHQGENEPAFEPRGNATLAPRCHAAAAGDAGHRARLGSILLQVPLTTPPRARSCFVPFLGSLGRLAVRRRSGPPPWPSHRHAHARVPVKSHASSHSRARLHARAPTWEVKAEPLAPFPCVGPR